MNTTRRFPRSMREAFPRDHSSSIICYRRPLLERVANVALAVALGVVGALLLAHWASS
jgi:hypothetical protein